MSSPFKPPSLEGSAQAAIASWLPLQPELPAAVPIYEAVLPGVFKYELPGESPFARRRSSVLACCRGK